MKKVTNLICLFALLSLIPCFDCDFSTGVDPDQDIEKQEISKTFASKEFISIQVVSGDCIVKEGQGDSIYVHLVYGFDPPGSFETEFKEEGTGLFLSEIFHGSSSGNSTWTITMPAETKIFFTSASGDFEAEDLKNGIEAQTASGDVSLKNTVGKFKINTASGDVELNTVSGIINISTASGDVDGKDISGEVTVSTASGNMEIQDSKGALKIETASGNVGGKGANGEFTLNTASGEVEIDGSKGAFKVKTASGDIDVTNVQLENVSYFGAASGDIYVSLSKKAEHDLSLSTASGDIVLNYNGNAIEGYFEFSARVDKGRIVSPVAFDSEEEVSQWGQLYQKKSFTRGKNTPVITISTASGTAELRER